MDADWSVHSDNLGSDHFPVCITYHEDNTMIDPIYTYNIKKADWNLYTRHANIQMDNTNTDSQYNSITHNITQASSA